MGSNKVPITEYDRAKAPWYFVWYKFLEIVGLWFFTFGLYYIGLFVLETYPSYQELLIKTKNITIPIGTLEYWFAGFIIILALTFTLFILINWAIANWKAAKRKTETSKGKKIREFFQKYEDRKEDRKKYGFCVGDEVEYICKEPGAVNAKRLGQKCIVGKIDSDGDIYPLWKDGTKGSVNGRFIWASSFKFKKKPLPKLK
ncbi:hypothetical protein LCGC14_0556810 [marine sediment metagenome]|uniref:Uncharacterized protein n=1 Tax=marine sediment metagenome TaxID=412755 RepID=A0A0F9UWL2_9ZZZZ